MSTPPRLVSSEIPRAPDEEEKMRVLLPVFWINPPPLVSDPILLQALSRQIPGKRSARAPANAQLVWLSSLDLKRKPLNGLSITEPA
jgi:hypothetical protein